jgi:hypothetical protein
VQEIFGCFCYSWHFITVAGLIADCSSSSMKNIFRQKSTDKNAETLIWILSQFLVSTEVSRRVKELEKICLE